MIQKIANYIIVVLCFVVIGIFGLRLLSSRKLPFVVERVKRKRRGSW